MSIAFLQERPGVKFEPSELVGEFGRSREALRKALSRLYKSGLIECESRVKTTAKGNASRYRVYFFPEVSDSSETLAPSEGELSDTLLDTLSDNQPVQEGVRQLKAIENQDFGTVGHNCPQTPPSFPLDGEKVKTSPTASPTDVSPQKTENSAQEDLRLGARVALKKKRTLSGEVTSIDSGIYTVTFDNGTMAWFYRHQLLKLE